MRLRRTRKRIDVEQLKKNADASMLTAKLDKIAARYAEECALAMELCAKNADILQQRIDDDTAQCAERERIGKLLDQASSVAYDLQHRVDNARKAMQDALKVGNADEASQHASAGVAMHAAWQAATTNVQTLQHAYADVWVSDLSDDERSQLPILRTASTSPSKAHALCVVKVDANDELRRLGAYVREHPAKFVNTPLPMRVAR